MFSSTNVLSKRTRIMTLAFFSFVMILLITGCQTSTAETSAPTSTPELASPTETSVPPTPTSLPPTPTPVPTSTPVPPTEVPDYSEKVDVGGYKLYIKCIGEGSPTLILEAPIGSDRTFWRNVLAENPTDMGVRVCYYDHAGKGYSEASPKRPRTVQDMAEDVHMLLMNANITGPYIYVGYGQGALIARMYRDLYPDEVAGLVLIDGGEESSVLDSLPPETEDEHPSIAKIREWATYMEVPKYAPESYDTKASAELLQSAAPLGDLPLVVLSRDPVNRQAQLDLWLQGFGSDTPLDVLNAIEDARAINMEKVAALSSNSKHIIVENGAYIVQRYPESVIDTFRVILEKVRGDY